MPLSLGVTLARLRAAGLAVRWRCRRCGSGCGAGVLVARGLGLGGPVRHGGAPEEVAGMVPGSTVLSFATLPPLLLPVM